jgi:CubicO group peptidase (beta-lactamase class C family)
MELEDRFDRIAQRALQNTGSPSLSIAAVSDGKVAYCKAFGNASTDSVYSIASVTKQFTAACILLLVRSGRLSLEDPVSKWFPQVTAAEKIRIHHVLTHTSGLPDYYPLSFADEEKRHAATPEAIVEKYARQPLQFEPGTQWSYSNTGFHLAGLILERVAGMPFGEFLEERVLRPAGMTHAFFNDPARESPQLLGAFTRYCLGPVRAIEPERAGWMYASGGIACTAADLAKWHTVLMDGRLLNADEIAIMTRPAALKDPGPSEPALGWFCERRGDCAIIQHSGGVAGFSSQTIVSLAERRSVVVLANGDYVQTGAIASELFEELVRGAKPPAPVAPADPEHAKKITAKWIERLRADSAPDPATLTPEFHVFLDEAHRDDARSGLRDGGDAKRFDAIASGERGGMAWYRVRCEFADRRADAVLRETTDGRLAEFMMYPVP